MRVAIIGAGVCGCTSAWYTHRALLSHSTSDDDDDEDDDASNSHEIILFEQGDRIGSSVRSVIVHDHTVEVGVQGEYGDADLRVHELVRSVGLQGRAVRERPSTGRGVYSVGVVSLRKAAHAGELCYLWHHHGFTLLDRLEGVLDRPGTLRAIFFMIGVSIVRSALFFGAATRPLQLVYIAAGLCLCYVGMRRMAYIAWLNGRLAAWRNRLVHIRPYLLTASGCERAAEGFQKEWRKMFRTGVTYCWSVAQFLRTANWWSWADVSTAVACRDFHFRLRFLHDVLEPLTLQRVFGRRAASGDGTPRQPLILQVNSLVGLRAMAEIRTAKDGAFVVQQGSTSWCERLLEAAGATVRYGRRVRRIEAVPAESSTDDAGAERKWRLVLDERARVHHHHDGDGDGDGMQDLTFDAVIIACSDPPPLSRVDYSRLQTPRNDRPNDRQSAPEAAAVSAALRDAEDTPSHTSTATGSSSRTPLMPALHIVVLVSGVLHPAALPGLGARTTDDLPDLLVFREPALWSDGWQGADDRQPGLASIERVARVSAVEARGAPDASRYVYKLVVLTAPMPYPPAFRSMVSGAPTAAQLQSIAEALIPPSMLSHLFGADQTTWQLHGVYASRHHRFACRPLVLHEESDRELANVLGVRVLYPSIIKRLAPGMEMSALGARMACTLLNKRIRWIVPRPDEVPAYETMLKSPLNRIGWRE